MVLNAPLVLHVNPVEEASKFLLVDDVGDVQVVQNFVGYNGHHVLSAQQFLALEHTE